MRYALWNNKGGVGKTFLSFVLATEIAHSRGTPVLVVDMCPQANLSEIVLGGNGIGSDRLDDLIRKRQTLGGYFDNRINSPHTKTGHEMDYLIDARVVNPHLPTRLFLLAGDPSLEIQAQVINQISGQTLPLESWRNVHRWLADIIEECSARLGADYITVFVDCNPSFSAYTELSMLATDALIIPCSSDGSSARAIDNVGSLLYGVATGKDYGAAGFLARANNFGMTLPSVHSVVLNRSTQYNKKASKAFTAMFDEIKRRVEALRKKVPQYFNNGTHFHDIPDSHSVAIVCSHDGIPLYQVTPGRYKVHDTEPQVNPEPLDRYKEAVKAFIDTIA
jgi:cellulose biosynthesis protein BcsQ